ncbi:phenylalanine--tRNA ligase subunit alpha [Elusimicrobiota bacterium]
MPPIDSAQITHLKTKALEQISAAKSAEDLESLKTSYLGRKGALTSVLKTIGNLPPDERKQAGIKANEAKNELASALEEKTKALKKTIFAQPKNKESDQTLPGRPVHFGNPHPLRIVADRILSVFTSMGFTYIESPEIETDHNNFTCLNIPEGHPARDMHDTLYLNLQDEKCKASDKTEWLLRTHTTPIQNHVMKDVAPPYRIVTYGKVFRREAIDATHFPVFHQVEAFVVDQASTFADLKTTLETWALKFFGPGIKIKFRPSYFPFTEPSCEVVLSCFMCNGKGCPTCKSTGWIEMLGAGMIHPQVLKRHGHDPTKWRGFAFGLGMERVAMALWSVPDIRLFWDNDLDFLSQFKEIV